MSESSSIINALIKYYWSKFLFCITAYVILDHKTSFKSLGYICSNSQKYIVWVKIIDFYFFQKSLGH